MFRFLLTRVSLIVPTFIGFRSEKRESFLEGFKKAEEIAVQLKEVGCDIITATNDILVKLKLAGKDLNDYSRETVRMFHNDAISAGFRIAV